jgi:enoyl-CoA hydratase/carnithine racemase
MDQLVLYAIDDKVGIVTLNRPSKLNAINAELRVQLVDGLGAALKWRAGQFAE